MNAINVHDVILIMTSYQCLIFAILLLTIRSEKRLRHILLALFLLQYAFIPLDAIVRFSSDFRPLIAELSPNFFYMFGFGYWLEGPLLLWYTRSLIYKNYTLSLRDAWLLLPFIFYLMYELSSYYRLDHEAKLAFQNTIMAFDQPHFRNYLAIFRDAFRFSLGVLCLIELRRYRQHLREKYSTIENRELNWLRLLVIGFLFVRSWALIVVLLVISSMHFELAKYFVFFGLTGIYLTFLLITLMIFYSLRGSLKSEELDINSQYPNDNDDKCNPEQIAILTRYMEQERAYLKSDLTLDKLATLTAISSRTLSRIINRHFKCNFFEFISAYRIDEARRLLSEDKDAAMNILNVMYAAGFNSKTTFNNLFKKRVGMTPSEYRKRAVQTSV